jgi:hypothetical protein
VTPVLKIRPTKTNFMYRRLFKQIRVILGIFAGTKNARFTGYFGSRKRNLLWISRFVYFLSRGVPGL